VHKNTKVTVGLINGWRRDIQVKSKDVQKLKILFTIKLVVDRKKYKKINKS